jgi:simple sugar transport system ATP-binding protein
MNVLFGLLRPDAGTMTLGGAPYAPESPAAALARGVGMVHQHFTLVDRLTVWENVWLAHPERPRWRLARARARDAARRLADGFGLDLDPDVPAGDLPVGARQRAEIAKSLARECRLLILDEPTAVLAPAEIDGLFAVIRRLRGRGAAVLFISHKLDEVAAIADRVTVLRHGRVAARRAAAGADRRELARAIVGEGAARPQEGPGGGHPGVGHPSGRPGGGDRCAAPLLEVESLSGNAGRVALRGVSFRLRAGEILGVTGVDGNGQDELVALLAGLAPAAAGSIRFRGEDVTRLGVRERWRRGLSVLPGDREREGLLAGAALWENLALREFGAAWARRGPLRLVSPAAHRARAAELLARHGVRAAGPEAPASSLSGGNRQKLLLARELASDPEAIVLLNPSRGLDVGAAEDLYRLLAGLRDRGRGVLLVSTELDEVLAVADRWAVLSRGAWREADRPDRELIGAMMLGETR